MNNDSENENRLWKLTLAAQYLSVRQINMNYIVVFYDGDNYNQAIEQELKRRGLEEGEVVVYAVPESLKNMGIDLAHTRQ